MSYKTAILDALARDYYIYIKRTHCTFEQAAQHFKTAQSTIHKRLSRLTHIQQAELHQIAYENRLNHQKTLTIMKRRRKHTPHGRRKTRVECTTTIYGLALRYSKYIVKTHCTIEEAAEYFCIPRSTLWWRLDKLNVDDRKPTKMIAAENMLHRRKRKC